MIQEITSFTLANAFKIPGSNAQSAPNTAAVSKATIQCTPPNESNLIPT